MPIERKIDDAERLPGLAEIEIARDSCREGCIYRGPAPRLAAE